MSIKKGNRRRCRRDYWFNEFVNTGFCQDWKAVKATSKAMRKMGSKV